MYHLNLSALDIRVSSTPNLWVCKWNFQANLIFMRCYHPATTWTIFTSRIFPYFGTLRLGGREHKTTSMRHEEKLLRRQLLVRITWTWRPGPVCLGSWYFFFSSYNNSWAQAHVVFHIHSSNKQPHIYNFQSVGVPKVIFYFIFCFRVNTDDLLIAWTSSLNTLWMIRIWRYLTPHHRSITEDEVETKCTGWAGLSSRCLNCSTCVLWYPFLSVPSAPLTTLMSRLSPDINGPCQCSNKFPPSSPSSCSTQT